MVPVFRKEMLVCFGETEKAARRRQEDEESVAKLDELDERLSASLIHTR